MACEKYDICPGFTRKKFCAHSEDVTVSPEKKENILAHSAMLLSVGDAERSLNKKFLVYLVQYRLLSSPSRF